MEENLEKIELFFDCDMKIKKIMYDLALNDEDTYDQESLIKYEDKLFKGLDTIEFYLTKILLLFGSNGTDLTPLKEKFTSYRENFISVQNNVAGLKQMYRKNISDMRKDFVNSVNENYVGYYLHRGQSVLEPTSINEYLHLLHASIVNNEEIYHGMPEIASVSENEMYSTHLYGKKNDTAYEIFKDFPIRDIRADILSLSDRILIMARDLGHALMIEITFKNEKAFVNYFIPKVCNYLMVNELNGITEVNRNSKFAKGSFEIEKDALKEALYDFLVKVPMDEDMFKEGGTCYREEGEKTL
ncbi:MAG: hypothetical protein PHI22_01480 [Bacilli bacterium]|nr:hypothetical protein [Bacilli bacterium]